MSSGSLDRAAIPAELLCESCKKNLALGVHSCPYQAEINNNDGDYCTCCSECQQECAWDI